MLILKTAKPIDKILSAPNDVIRALEVFAETYDDIGELREDINKCFNSPVLLAALSRLEELIKQRTTALDTMQRTGYTTDDAFQLSIYREAENEATA